METTVEMDNLEWLNNLLLTKFTKLEQICSGMCFALQ